MSESKKVEYRRDRCKEKIRSLLQRAEEINTGKADYNYYNKIKDIILFGSLVNTDKERVHDIDILVVWEDNRDKMMQFYLEHPNMFGDYIKDMFAEWFLTERYLRNGSRAFSIHTSIIEDDGIIGIAKSDAHVVLMSDYKVVPDYMKLIP